MNTTFNGFVTVAIGSTGSRVLGTWSDGRVIELVAADDGALTVRDVLTVRRVGSWIGSEVWVCQCANGGEFNTPICLECADCGVCRPALK